MTDDRGDAARLETQVVQLAGSWLGAEWAMVLSIWHFADKGQPKVPALCKEKRGPVWSHYAPNGDRVAPPRSIPAQPSR